MALLALLEEEAEKRQRPSQAQEKNSGDNFPASSSNGMVATARIATTVTMVAWDWRETQGSLPADQRLLCQQHNVSYPHFGVLSAT